MHELSRKFGVGDIWGTQPGSQKIKVYLIVSELNPQAPDVNIIFFVSEDISMYYNNNYHYSTWKYLII